jgi:hypothetical protein
MVIVPGPARPGIARLAWAASTARRAAWHGPMFKAGPLETRKSFHPTGLLNIISQNLTHRDSLVFLSPLSSSSILFLPLRALALRPSFPSCLLPQAARQAAVYERGGGQRAAAAASIERAGNGRHGHDRVPMLFGPARHKNRPLSLCLGRGCGTMGGTALPDSLIVPGLGPISLCPDQPGPEPGGPNGHL